MRITAREIIREARELGLDPVEHARDLADGFGWDEDSTYEAVESVRSFGMAGVLPGNGRWWAD